MFSYKLDWISATVFMDEAIAIDTSERSGALSMVSRLASDLGLKVDKKPEFLASAPAPYRYALAVDGLAGRVFVPVNWRRQGIMITASGKSLPSPVDGWKLYSMLRNVGAQFTRIDFAFDLIDGADSVDEYMAAASSVFSEARTAAFYRKDNAATGYTLGSRQSEMYYRVYNKALEQGVERNWMRVELEVKGERVKQFGADYASAWAMAAAAVMKKCVVDGTEMMDELREVFGEGKVVTPLPVKVNGSRQLWLWGDVLSAFKAFVKDDPEAARDYVTGLNLICEATLLRSQPIVLTEFDD